MHGNNLGTTSIWHKQQPYLKNVLSLEHGIKPDVCIVGAGISGLTTAYLLAKQGKSVCIVDAWGIAGGETSLTTAHLTAILDERYYKLKSSFGAEKVKLMAESHLAAINKIESVVQEENIACDFERLNGYLIAETSQQYQVLEKEYTSISNLGFMEGHFISKFPTKTSSDLSALCLPNQATFNLAKYIQGLITALNKLNVKIYLKHFARSFHGGNACYVEMDNGIKINCGKLVIATNTPINDRLKLHTKQEAYRSYVAGFEVPKNSYEPFLLWDLQDPYHYVRIVHEDEADILLVGGEDHKTGQDKNPDQHFHNLKRWAQQYFDLPEDSKYKWSGQIIEPTDSVAYIGKNPGEENMYIATGYSGNGITYGTIAGILITDLILGNDNPWAKFMIHRAKH